MGQEDTEIAFDLAIYVKAKEIAGFQCHAIQNRSK